MFLGVVQAVCAPTAWLESTGLTLESPFAGGRVHLGFAPPARIHQAGHLTVVAESGGGGGADPRAIAETYTRYGQGALGRLQGRFRFLLHDARGPLLVGGASTTPPWPLAYHSSRDRTIVSTSILAVTRCPEVPRELDNRYLVHQIMGFSAASAGTTALRDVRRLCPGEVVEVTDTGTRTWSVDRLVPRRPPAGKRGPDTFLEELGKAVEKTCRGSRAVVSLSGGLDSATVVAASMARRSTVSACSFVAPALAPTAEIQAITTMERAWPSVLSTRVDVSNDRDLPDEGPDLRDDPPLVPLALLPGRMRLWAHVHSVGFRTVVEGEAADELFSMLPTPIDALLAGRLLRAARQVLESTSQRRDVAEHGVWLPLLPRPLQDRWLTRRHPLEALLPAFASWDAVHDPLVVEAADQFRAVHVHRPFAQRVVDWLSAPTVVGAAMSRRHLAARQGVELEWPMLDRDVLELVLGLHAAGEVLGGAKKNLLRDATAGIVPDEVRLRPKDVGLYAALIPRVLTSHRAREALRDRRVRARLEPLVRFARVEAMLDGLAAGRPLSSAALWQLECLVSFAEWYARAARDFGVK